MMVFPGHVFFITFERSFVRLYFLTISVLKICSLTAFIKVLHNYVLTLNSLHMKATYFAQNKN